MKIFLREKVSKKTFISSPQCQFIMISQMSDVGMVCDCGGGDIVFKWGIKKN